MNKTNNIQKSCKQSLSKEEARRVAVLIVEASETILSRGVRGGKRIIPAGNFIDAVF